MSLEEIGLLLGGLGLFLFGTLLFEGSITSLVNKTFKNLLKTATNTLFKAIATGTFATTILQSSAVVSLIVVSFVGAGILNLSNGVGIILGANIGGPLTDIFLGNLGLKFSLSSIAFPILGIAGLLMLIFSRHTKFVAICKAIFGLGLLFLGLGYMKESMVPLATTFDFVKYAGYPMIIFFGIGALLTILMQSSSATTVLVLTAASAGMVDYHMGVPMLMGAFLATTLTVVLGSLSGDAIKKQVAFSHVFFNVFSVIIGFICMGPILYILHRYFPTDVILGLSFFAMAFKIICALLILPVFGLFIKFLKKLFPQHPTSLGLYIENTSPTVLDAAKVALDHDTKKLLKKVFGYVMNSWGVEVDMMLHTRTVRRIASVQVFLDGHQLAAQYRGIKQIEQKLITFISQAQASTTNPEENDMLVRYYQAVSALVYTAKYIKDISQNIERFHDEDDTRSGKKYQDFRVLLIELYKTTSQIIDGVRDDVLIKHMMKSISQIKRDDQIFLHTLSKEINQESISDFELSDVLHLHHYVYLSSMSFVNAVHLLLLKDKQVDSIEISE
ncbi:MAG: Na/Pi symporter [Candidatus Absconditabacteria bacterium]